MMTIGTKIVWLQTSLEDTTKQIIAEGTITRIGWDTYYVDHHHKAEGQIYAAYCLPDTEKSRRTLQNFIDEAARHKQADNDNSAVLYQLRNEYIRTGQL
jgi:hypothetical protein